MGGSLFSVIVIWSALLCAALVCSTSLALHYFDLLTSLFYSISLSTFILFSSFCLLPFFRLPLLFFPLPLHFSSLPIPSHLYSNISISQTFPTIIAILQRCISQQPFPPTLSILVLRTTNSGSTIIHIRSPILAENPLSTFCLPSDRIEWSAVDSRQRMAHVLFLKISFTKFIIINKTVPDHAIYKPPKRAHSIHHPEWGKHAHC